MMFAVWCWQKYIHVCMCKIYHYVRNAITSKWYHAFVCVCMFECIRVHQSWVLPMLYMLYKATQSNGTIPNDPFVHDLVCDVGVNIWLGLN